MNKWWSVFVSSSWKQMRNVHGMNKHSDVQHRLARKQKKKNATKLKRIHRHSLLSERLEAQVILWMIRACAAAVRLRQKWKNIWLTSRWRLHYAHNHNNVQVHAPAAWPNTYFSYANSTLCSRFDCGERVCEMWTAHWTTCIVHSFNFLSLAGSWLMAAAVIGWARKYDPKRSHQGN